MVKKTVLVLAVGSLLFTGCAQKNLEGTAISGSGTEMMIEKRLEHRVDAEKLKNAIVKAAKSIGWMTTPLGERKIIAEKYFSETKNIAAEISLGAEGYTIEYSSGQNVESEAADLLEDLENAIEKELKKESEHGH
ncbi:hypothetical protein [Hydrogenimonas cancrithermarum]|uniref:Lipoprotein n=1 Tax=Hydrogenimonas cancrithermarum TaxID=2993563 RepID=A0ABM8FKQ8_9BACT|nr:hypothetical protein [Hydrogenimonas cancrithermarum]BDY12898.1 hypothetical protein HCR_12100 [Hydrogenimonas cancrithermarum]BDY13015.1 hypothetical protein HCR_13270 [Hydrogenimonas cancrithermarum]